MFPLWTQRYRGRMGFSTLRKWPFSGRLCLSVLSPAPSALHCLSTLINMSDRKPDNRQGLVLLVGETAFKMSGLNELYLHFFGLQLLKDFHFPHRRDESKNYFSVCPKLHLRAALPALHTACKLTAPMRGPVATHKVAAIRCTHLPPRKH